MGHSNGFVFIETKRIHSKSGAVNILKDFAICLEKLTMRKPIRASS